MTAKTPTELLTQVGPGTAMNKLGKRFWLPIFRSEAVVAGGKPERVELFGEKYVLWRADDNRLGFFNEKCPHRRASLALGRNEDCALTCIYHGWKFGVDGKVLDLPSEPAGSREKRKALVKLKHYAVKEINGLVWVYIGDQDAIPEFPDFEFNVCKPEQFLGIRAIINCSWLPTIEAGMDASHLNVLHAGHMGSVGEDDGMSDWKLIEESDPVYDIEQTNYGFTEAATRTLGNGISYLRKRHFVMPFFSFVPLQHGMTQLAIVSIPVNNNRCIQWIFNYTTKDSIFEELGRQTTVSAKGKEQMMNINNYAEGMGTVHNLWGQDREYMKEHFSGIPGPLPWEDIAVTESMGEVDHSEEFLGEADFVILKMRRFLAKILGQIDSGQEPDFDGSNAKNLSALRSVSFEHTGELDWKAVDCKNVPENMLVK